MTDKNLKDADKFQARMLEDMPPKSGGHALVYATLGLVVWDSDYSGAGPEPDNQAAIRIGECLERAAMMAYILDHKFSVVVEAAWVSAYKEQLTPVVSRKIADRVMQFLYHNKTEDFQTDTSRLLVLYVAALFSECNNHKLAMVDVMTKHIRRRDNLRKLFQSEQVVKLDSTVDPVKEPRMAKPVQVGDRVGAILKADKEQVWLLGYGVYQGHQLLPEGLSLYTEHKNPKILLENGQVVWGLQCWWGSEESIKKSIGARKVIDCVVTDDV